MWATEEDAQKALDAMLIPLSTNLNKETIMNCYAVEAND